VTVCRCGTEVLDADELAARSSEISPASIAIAVLLLAAVVAAGYWSWSRPPVEVAAALPGARVATGPGTTPGNSSEQDAAAEPGSAAINPWTGMPAKPPPAAEAEAAVLLEDVVSRVMPAVVLVESTSGRGSGFFVRPDTVITNAHVVKEDGFVKLRQVDGTAVTARVDLKAPAFDIAILRVTTPSANQVVIPMGTANTLRPGQEVFTIGSPFGTLHNSVTRGVVSGLRRSGAATMVQNDAAANPGNSGGPLLDRSGVAIGITTMGDRDKPGINYAVAIDHARAILDGGLVESTAAPLALADVKPLAPVQSESSRDEGERTFVAATAELARSADVFDVEWKKFRAACYTTALPASPGREWFVMLSSRAVLPSQVGGGQCAAFLAGFQADASRLGAAMRSALDAARRAGVLPGVVRDALRSNRLEFDGWDR